MRWWRGGEGDLRGGETSVGVLWDEAFGEVDFFLAGGEVPLEGDDTLPERSSDVIDRLALWELSDRSLRFSFFSLCFSVSRPRSFASFCFSTDFSLFLCLPLCFFPITGISRGTGGGGLGVRGPFFLLWLPFEGLVDSETGEGTNAFFSFFPEPGPLVPLLCFGDPLDFLDEGESCLLNGSEEAFGMAVALVLVGVSSFLMTMSSLLSKFSCSNFISSR